MRFWRKCLQLALLPWACWPVLAAAQEVAPAEAVTAADAATATAEIHPTVEAPPPPMDHPQPAEPPAHSPWQWHVGLAQRFGAQSVSVVEGMAPVATEAARIGPSTGMEVRSRGGAELEYHADSGFFRKAAFAAEALFRYFDWRDAPLPGDAVVLTKGRAELTTLAGQFTLGRTQSQWGLGVLANDGAYDPLQFGFKRGEQAVTRLGWGFLPAALFQKGDPTRALPLAIAVARDWVARDDLASLPGDAATQNIAALLYRGPVLQAGAYVVMRDQTGSDGLGLKATVGDGFFRYRRQHGSDYVELAAEGVMARGHTTWLKSPALPDGLDVAQFGGVVRLETGNARAAARIEGGLASADSLPLNGTLRSFRFAQDYHVGLVMFSQAQRLLSAQAMANLSDPRYAGNAPEGVARVATLGAVSQATYVHTVARLQPFSNLAVLLGGLWADSPSPVADPFRSFLNGGQATGPRGAVGKRGLGLEVDAGVECTAHVSSWLAAVARIDGGVWFPGDAFADAAGQAMAAVGVVQGSLLLRSEF